MATASDGEMAIASGMNLLDLPDCMIEEVLEYLSYDEIAKKRIVCRKIDRICQSLLNRGYIKMIRRHNSNLKAIKSQLPRRESERRNHPLSKHSDILTCVETRISMLSMTYSKYIDKELCCFIPGKVIDEVLYILRIVENTGRPLRAHEVLQELRDISSMAIEHFDENIAGRLKKLMNVHNPHHQVPVHPFPTVGYFPNEMVLPSSAFCPDVPGEKFLMPTLAPLAQPGPSIAGPSSSAPMGSLYCQSGCNASRENNASIVRINHKARKMRYDINRIDHTMAGFKAEVRNMRMHMLRQSAEMKDIRRRLDESEMKNRELIATINQFGSDNPKAAALKSELTAATIKRANLKIRKANAILQRALSETEPRGPDRMPRPAFAAVPFPLGLASPISSDEEDFLPPSPTMEGSAPKKGRFAIRGCKQYANLVGYDEPLEYFPTKNLQHVGRTDSSKFFRVAILGPNDGHIRFGSSPYPYDKDMIEIVLSGWANTKSVGRRQRRTKANKYVNVLLAEEETPNLLSPFRPTMFVLEVFSNGTVQVRKDGENQAFLQFNDGVRSLPIDYMAFTK
uniref:Uncharacterized protein n=1 Tax=Anopheles atroparvus TaxID=41427 RepID=A0A182INV5_ANOAO